MRRNSATKPTRNTIQANAPPKSHSEATTHKPSITYKANSIANETALNTPHKLETYENYAFGQLGVRPLSSALPNAAPHWRGSIMLLGNYLLEDFQLANACQGHQSAEIGN